MVLSRLVCFVEANCTLSRKSSAAVTNKTFDRETITKVIAKLFL